jgi:hypothetical protein
MIKEISSEQFYNFSVIREPMASMIAKEKNGFAIMMKIFLD